MIVATVVLGLVVPLLGLLPWPRPVWSPDSRWLVTDVPPPLWALILGTTAVCVATAVVLTVRAAHLRMRDLVTWVWVALVLLAAAALVWNAVYAAALSTIEFGSPIPIFHWLFAFAPAVLAGWLFAQRGREARRVAALGTGVVTVPLFALGWALLFLHPEPLFMAIAGTAQLTVILGVAPLIGGVALAGVMGREPARRMP
jgi:hypothetical protein